MPRAAAILTALLATSAVADNAAAQSGLPPGTVIDTVARGLEIPWGVAFAPDGTVFISERPGRIRIMRNGSLRPEPWTTLLVATPPAGAGLLGLALAPDFAQSRALYVVGSFPTGRDSVVENRLYRIRDQAGRGGQPELLLDSLPSARAHAGSAVVFGPDGKLYITLGDAFQPDEAANPASFNGKILRLEGDGSPAAGNPTPGSPVYALGLRNTQGLAWDPATGTLFGTEHGPSAWPWENGRRHEDELNVLVPGGNYGWPRVAGMGSEPGLLDPIVSWTPAIAPSGLILYAGAHRPWRGSLLLGALRGQHLRRIVIERGQESWRVVAQHEIHVLPQPTRMRGVFTGPDGHVYVTTSDRRTADGQPDDLLLRIRLPS